MIAEFPCPCGLAAASVVTVAPGRMMLRCTQCRLLARTPMPSSDELAQRYGEEYWARYKVEQIGSSRTNLCEHVMRWVMLVHPSPGTLVDVGCGGGAFLEICRKWGWRGIGFDPSRSAVAYARSMGLEAYEAVWPPCHLQAEAADVVAFNNVLDHMQRPFAALDEAWRVLRPGGWLYIRLPNGPFHAAVISLLSRLRLDHLAVFHLYGFSRRAFLYHLPRLGFAQVCVRTAPPSAADAYTDSVGWAVALRRVLKAVDRGVYGIFKKCALTGLAWGPSIEVMASKAAEREPQSLVPRSE